LRGADWFHSLCQQASTVSESYSFTSSTTEIVDAVVGPPPLVHYCSQVRVLAGYVLYLKILQTSKLSKVRFRS